MPRVKNSHHKLIKQVFLVVVLWRLGLFFLAAVAEKFFIRMPSFPYADILENSGLPAWLHAWANFDGVHYLTIIERGYVGTGLIQAFFPVYPILVKSITVFGISDILAGVLVSFVFTLATAALLYTFARERYGKSVADWTLISLLAFPTSFFMGAVYSEAIFIFLVLVCFLAAEKKQWLFAAIAAGLASGTRIVGIALLPYLLLELWQQAQNEKDWKKYFYQHLPKLIFAVTGLVLYMLYLQFEFSDPVYFLHVQSEFGGGRQESLVVYPQVVWRSIKILLTAETTWMRYLTFISEFVAGIGAVLAAVIFYRKLKLSEVVFVLFVCLLPTTTGTFSSMPRYILVAVPLFLILGRVLAKYPRLRFLYLTVSIFLLIINTMLFVQGYWVA